jgi:hypothetical protein
LNSTWQYIFYQSGKEKEILRNLHQSGISQDLIAE